MLNKSTIETKCVYCGGKHGLVANLPGTPDNSFAHMECLFAHYGTTVWPEILTGAKASAA